MKLVLIGILAVSLALLLYILFSRKIGWGWLSRFGLHIVLAALGIYVINFSGLMTEVYIPLNPVTLSAVVILGLPGVALLVGLKLTMI
ncbi:MAG: pro-sigmaK processing inhibitor BofA family protein [Paenibacillaceae bacterium]|uniref:Pro-sigmaK processing inhibitor BofA family protein n=1 Tax=Paenibacillus mellifer TaxID=2937794 RepID=A0A9X2BS27_9BACL|nr:pro-sigmaK processing inhibitor BofA family protein [Paenibacillus mellifer]MBW4840830.1 pro-sigmaK processing inhibitor BofA family protein [Paenibacillaceae bacterium]MCK8490113.1 pro-sigmaK processing inhibitor BofA family protein [Paenibacillus mellifer]